MSPAAALLFSVVLLGFNALFVGAEFALISARRSEIEPRAEEGGRMARITISAMENVSLMMAGAQLGITLCTLGLGALAEPAIAHGLEAPFESIGIPDEWFLAGHIVVGWPRGKHGPVRRRPLSDVVFRNQWDPERADITYGRGARPRR